eukprot:NODE_910_length_3155_cov_0.267343.p3 type:complete len:118 gc:universal NODE_910_length_3155_cov_0.267343:1723-1370(-)
MRCSTNLSACLSNSEAKTVTLVVPSPTSSSCACERLTRSFAAGLSIETDFKIVAPSFVTCMLVPDCKILSIPLGPRVDLIKSPIAAAATNIESLASSPRSSIAPFSNNCNGLDIVRK